MFRRCISLLVLVGLLASHLAAIPHAHARISAEEQQKHDATPHFHGSWFGHEHHGHDHSHGGHAHQHGQPSKPANESPDQRLTDGVVVLDHDASAVYVPVDASAAATGNQQRDLPASSLVWAAVCTCQGANPAIDWGDEISPWHPPDAVLDGSNTYLTLRSLRI